MIAIYVSANKFNVLADRTLEFTPGRRVKINCGVDGIVYSTVVSSVFATPYTTITISESALTTNLSVALYGIVNVGSQGSFPDHDHSGDEGFGGRLDFYHIASKYFTSLSDVPNTYDGSEGKYLKATTSGLSFNNLTIEDDNQPKLGGDLDLNDFNIRYTSTLSEDHSYRGDVGVGVVGDTVSFGNLLYWSVQNQRWRLSDATSLYTMGRMTMALSDGSDGDSVLMLIKGYVRDDSWSWTTDDSVKFLYASLSPGSISEIPVSGTGNISQINMYIISSNKIFFEPSAYVEVG